MRLRPDAIGDLARDMVLAWSRGGRFPAHPKNLDEVVDHLRAQRACPEALDAARDAWAEYLAVTTRSS